MTTISIEKTRKELSANSGLIFFYNLISRLNLEGILGSILPRKQRERGLKTKNKFILGINALIAGADCIDDIDFFSHDLLFRELLNGRVASTTMGKFLRTFRLKEIEKLQNYLPILALSLRKKLFPNDNNAIITMDSTPHVQHGLKMEGVAWNYANKWCLDSQNAFDQYGFSYGWHLRPGNTYSGNDAMEMIERVFSKIPKEMKRFFRADSAYGNLGIYNALITKKVNFAICLKENAWSALLDKYQFNIGWKSTKIKFFESKKCQIGSCLYPLEGLVGRSFLRVVFIRSKKKEITKEDKRDYDYYAIVTNMSEYEMNDEQIIRFYRGRSNVENHIKDLKYGMDFLHFPCQKLNANRAWGMMGIFAYNLMRFASFILEPKTGCFLKKVRNRMVKLAGEVTKHARKTSIRFSKYIYQEVLWINKEIAEKFSVGFYRLKGMEQAPPPQ